MKKLKVFLATLVALAIVIAPFGGLSQIKAAIVKGNQLIIPQISDPINLVPFNATDDASSTIYRQVYRGLLKADYSRKFVPDLAAEMPTISADGLTYTFKLKQNVKWDDGTPFTSADVKYSIDYQMNPKAGAPRMSSFGDIVKEITTPDKYTVVFKLNYKDNTTISTFTNPYIVPKHILEDVPMEKNMTNNPLAKKPVGCGPWKFVEWIPNERVVLERNPNYDGIKPKADKLIFKNVGSTAQITVQLQTQEADGAAVQPADLALIKTQKHLNVYTYGRFSYDYMSFNTKTPFFSDKRVRQAIAHAVNKQAIINGIYKGMGTPGVTQYYPIADYYKKNVKQYNYDLAKAKALLDAAGWKVGKDGIRVKDGKKFEVTLITNKGNTSREKAIVVIQSQLKLVGIKVNTRVYEWNTYITKYLRPRNFDMLYSGIVSSDWSADVRALVHSDKAIGQLNYGSYTNKTLDGLMYKAVETFDKAEAQKLHYQIQDILAEDVPSLVILYPKTNLAVNKRISNVKYADGIGIDYNYVPWTVTQ